MTRLTLQKSVPAALLVAIPVVGIGVSVWLWNATPYEPSALAAKTPPYRHAALLLDETGIDGSEMEGESAAVVNDASPHMAREAAREQAANVGAIGSVSSMVGSWNGPSSPYGADSAAGQDSLNAMGALMGDQIGSNYGFGGLGLRGTGRGGGGTGTGTLGTIGHGAGGYRSRLPPDVPLPNEPVSGEDYAHVDENPFVPTAEQAISTFSVDVDTASYTNVRRYLRDGMLPPPDAVRVEEMINFFDPDYAGPRSGGHPFAIHTESGACPWNPDRRLLSVGIQGRRIDRHDLPPRNLVFLVDVSGSMSGPGRLPLLVEGLGLLVDDLRPQDSVSLVVYAGAAGVVLPPTSGSNRARIRTALQGLRSGGSTHGSQGIRTAYQLAHESFDRRGINRVILATDGDFNVGVTSDAELTELIEEQRESGVFLTVLGFGTGNYQDARMEMLADHGNGNYAYIDTLDEAHRMLVREASGTLWTIAQDVKIQMVFDPERVRGYRLIGYENRLLRTEDFDDDTRDAGEVGAGHHVTALYEVDAAGPGPLGTVRVRYQRPGGSPSVLLERAARDDGGRGAPALRFAAAVAGFGMALRGSEHLGGATLASLSELARGSVASGDTPRHEAVALMDIAQALRAN